MQQQNVTTIADPTEPLIDFLYDTYPNIFHLKSGSINDELRANLKIQCNELNFRTGEPSKGDRFIKLFDHEEMGSVIRKYWPPSIPQPVEGLCDSIRYYASTILWSNLMRYMGGNSDEDDTKGSLRDDFFVENWESRM